MALFTAEEARSAFRERQPYLEYKRPDLAIFGEQLASLEKTGEQHDVFLSYSHMDAEIVLGICYILRNKFGLTVYLDRDDATLSENDVQVADQLRRRMRSCLSLVYVASDNDSQSHWMPWELGYFDGLRGTVAVLPVTESATAEEPHNRPYLRLYPYIDKDMGLLWIYDRKGHVQQLREWLRNGGKFHAVGA